MAKKQKKKKREEPEKLRYEIEVEDWEEAYHFGLNTLPRDLIEGLYWECSKLILTGKILSPVLEKAGKTKIEIVADPPSAFLSTVRKIEESG